MKQSLIAVLCMVMVVLGMQAADDVPELKRAILMVYYGTSDDSVRAVGIDAMTERVRRAFPGVEVREAWTSRAAVDALRCRKGIRRLRVAEALEQLRADGYNSVFVGCGELLEGKDARNVQRLVYDKRRLFFEIDMTTPLLYTAEDCRQALEVLVRHVAPEADEHLVLVGHGKDEAYNDVYCLCDYILQHEGHANCHVGTISGYPSIDNIKQILRQSGTRRVVLAPLIMIASGHATKDIFKTWREKLEAEGYSVRLVRHGVREYEEIQQMIIDKIKELTMHNS